MFEEAHEQWMKRHILKRSGERLRRLKEGHGYAEKLFLQHVWWPSFGHLNDDLHPEYEVMDFRFGAYFLDFAYIPAQPFPRIAIEIDGFGPHAKNIDRKQFGEQLNRQNFLVATDWRVLRFSVDDVKEQPFRCSQYLQLLLGKYFTYGGQPAAEKVELVEKELLRLALTMSRPIKSTDVMNHFRVSRNTAHHWLKRLADKQLIIPHGGRGRRIRSFLPNRENTVGIF
ncbi:endonuclease domain-containing protein [Paenibacillus hamazuiensis]|uniref:endonuclease domain-containing protein n=1 Tax=Paenibacillus hamazuiensis TaxID=2936508 RepID=UPI00200DB686|nr:endonuclease domain-containing protein [Paenibacillus hamazuiensis]